MIAVTTAIPELYPDVPGAPRVETELYYAGGTSFGVQLATPLLADAPELGRHVLPIPLPPALLSDDLFAIALRAKDERELHGDEAFQLGEGVELLAGQLDAERNAHQATMLALDAAELARDDAREELDLVRQQLAATRRQLSDARDQLLVTRLSAATVTITQVSYAELTAQWAAQDARELADLARRQLAHEERGRFRSRSAPLAVAAPIVSTIVLAIAMIASGAWAENGPERKSSESTYGGVCCSDARLRTAEHQLSGLQPADRAGGSDPTSGRIPRGSRTASDVPGHMSRDVRLPGVQLRDQLSLAASRGWRDRTLRQDLAAVGSRQINAPFVGVRS